MSSQQLISQAQAQRYPSTSLRHLWLNTAKQQSGARPLGSADCHTGSERPAAMQRGALGPGPGAGGTLPAPAQRAHVALEPWGPGAFPILHRRSWLQQLPGQARCREEERRQGGPVLTPGPELRLRASTSVLRPGAHCRRACAASRGYCPVPGGIPRWFRLGTSVKTHVCQNHFGASSAPAGQVSSYSCPALTLHRHRPRR